MGRRKIDKSNNVLKCSTCKEIKEKSEFHKNLSKDHGRHKECKDCRLKKLSLPHIKLKASIKKKALWSKLTPQQKREKSLKRIHGIELKQYIDLEIEQNKSCAVCKRILGKEIKRLCIDHDHKTNFIRGLLCDECNHGIGNFKDDISLLHSAINYLSNSLSIQKELNQTKSIIKNFQSSYKNKLVKKQATRKAGLKSLFNPSINA